MTAPELLADLRARGIRVRVVGDRLRLAPLEVLTPELLEVVRQHKPELLRLLAGRHEVSTPAACSWCGGALAPYPLDLAGRPALLCPTCKRWTLAGGAT
jgi:hypothetical protein